MATYKSHISLSTLIAVAYAVSGLLFLNVAPEHAILASVVIIIAGMLPDIDTGSGATPREIGGLLAAISPLVVLEFYPHLKSSGIARLSLVVISCYVLTRVIVNRVLFKFTSPRGVVHSIPAAIITFELVYLLFWDLYWIERLYIAFAAFAGYFSHLLLDASSNLELLGNAMGAGADGDAPVLKLTGKTPGSTLVLYASMLVLGYYVVQDLYPGLLPVH